MSTLMLYFERSHVLKQKYLIELLFEMRKKSKNRLYQGLQELTLMNREDYAVETGYQNLHRDV
jgi:hypothetical protein